MPIIYIGGSRESLTFTAEKYKEAVRKYLESRGYYLTTDSYVEGHLCDMVLVHKSLPEKLCVECKATELSINNKQFCSELLTYFVMWIELPEDDRFKLFIFTKSLRNKKNFEKIFGIGFSEDALKEWLSKHIEDVKDELRKKIESTNFDVLSDFFTQVEIYVADIERLTLATEERITTSNFSLQNYARTLLKKTENRILPIRKKTELISNLISFTPPDIYYVAKVKGYFKKQKDIYDYFNNAKVEIPPFLFNPNTQKISTFSHLDDKNPLSEITIEDPVEIKFRNNDLLNMQFKITLINQHLRRIFWKKGLRRVPEKNIYFFECFENNGVFVERVCSVLNKKKVVAIPYYPDSKKDKIYYEDTLLYFIPSKEDHASLEDKITENSTKRDNYKQLYVIFHHAAEIAPKFIWDDYYIQIIPRKIYTKDGVTPLTGKEKDNIDRKFRNPTYNRNAGKLLELSFWVDYLFKDKRYEKKPESWFKEFKFGDYLKFEFDWISKPLPLVQSNQTTLTDFSI